MKYLIEESEVCSGQANFSELLADCYKRKERPLCLCKLEGVEMYIAKVNNQYFLKRMPGTGFKHDIQCSSFEPPLELSGLGALVGSAIKEDKDITKIKVDFSLSKGEGSRSPVIGEGNSKPGEITADATRLTMRGLLHYLYEQSGLNRFDENLSVKRNWYNTRKMLLHAASQKTVNGNSLANILFIPETFILDKKDDIKARRKVAVSQAFYKGYGKREMMMIIGEVKDISPDAYGYKITIKHLPDIKFKISDDLYKKINQKHSEEIEIWKELEEDGHLLLMGTFYIDIRGFWNIETCTLQVTDKNWIIVENRTEIFLVNSLYEQKRSFIKGLRYNLKEDTPFASALLLDSHPPTAMYIHSEDAKDIYGIRLEVLTKESSYNSWIWATGESMPLLP